MAKFSSQEKSVEIEAKCKTRPSDLPDGWLMLRLENVCKLKSGYAFKSSEYIKDSGIPVIRISDIGDGQVKTQNCIRVLEKQEYKSFFIEKGEILVAMSGATTGKFGIFKSDEKVYQNQRVGKFQPLSDHLLNNSFLYYLLHSLKRQILRDAYGGAQPNISSRKIEELLIPLPPPAEQQRIVTKIEELFSRLDAGVECLKKAQAQLKIYRQAVLKWAFEKSKYKSGGNHDSIKWSSRKISEIAMAIGGYAFKSGDFKTSGRHQVIRIGNVRPGIIRFDENPVYLNDIDEQVFKKAALHVNDVVITQTGTKGKRDYGFTALIPKTGLLLNQRIAAIRCNEKCLPKFLMYFTWTDTFKNQFFANETGNVGQGNVGIKAITDSQITVPPTNIQAELISEIEKRLSVCDKLEESIAQGLKQAEALKQSILKKAFEGKLVPQIPDDEPASMLLERIRSEREKPATGAAKNATTTRKKKKPCTTQ